VELENIIPWGRSFEEYEEMFSLSKSDVNLKILGCCDGPAGFNAEVSKAGGHVVSVDPVYQFSAQEIRSRIDDVYPQVLSRMEENKEDFIWQSIANVEVLGKIRMMAMERFLDDYALGKEEGRYINASLPELAFRDGEFDLALCSHYLFLYSPHVDEEQHILAMKELCRVAKEVRVYPLPSLDGNESKHLNAVLSALTADGMDVSLPSVRYQFQKGATKMLMAKKL